MLKLETLFGSMKATESQQTRMEWKGQTLRFAFWKLRVMGVLNSEDNMTTLMWCQGNLIFTRHWDPPPRSCHCLALPQYKLCALSSHNGLWMGSRRDMPLWVNLHLSWDHKPGCHIRKECRKARHPTPVILPGESHGHRSLAGYSPWGHKELDTTEAN